LCIIRCVHEYEKWLQTLNMICFSPDIALYIQKEKSESMYHVSYCWHDFFSPDALCSPQRNTVPWHSHLMYCAPFSLQGLLLMLLWDSTHCQRADMGIELQLQQLSNWFCRSWSVCCRVSVIPSIMLWVLFFEQEKWNHFSLKSEQMFLLSETRQDALLFYEQSY
jgi:hypothetical protein